MKTISSISFFLLILLLSIGAYQGVNDNFLKIYSGDSLIFGNIKLDQTDGIILRNTTIVWDDSQVPPLSIGTGVTQPALTSGFGGNASLVLPYFQGGGTVNDECWFTIQFSHKLAQNYDSIYPHIHCATTTTDTGSFEFELIYTWKDIGSTFSAADTIVKLSPNINPAAQWKHQILYFPAIKNTGGFSSIIVCRLRRLNSNARDTYPSNVAFLGFDIHYPINSLGNKVNK